MPFAIEVVCVNRHEIRDSSIRRFEVKRYQAVWLPSVGRAARGFSLLFGISRLALPAWDQENGWRNLTRVPITLGVDCRASGSVDLFPLQVLEEALGRGVVIWTAEAPMLSRMAWSSRRSIFWW